jgi:hypothetical protein
MLLQGKCTENAKLTQGLLGAVALNFYWFKLLWILKFKKLVALTEQRYKNV